jgi:hypothetical protein
MLSAAAVNKTFVSPDIVKWSGFQVIGESLLNVVECQNHPYDSPYRNETLERAILETPDLSEQVRTLTAIYLTITGTRRKVFRVRTACKEIVFESSFCGFPVDFKNVQQAMNHCV